MSSRLRVGMLALGLVGALNFGVSVYGQSCSPGSSITVKRATSQLGPTEPPWQSQPLAVSQFNAGAGQVLLRADITVVGIVSGSTQGEYIAPNTPGCNWAWCLGSAFQVHVPVPMQPALLLQGQTCGLDPLTGFDGILDFRGSSGATNIVLPIQAQVSLSITDPAVLASVFTGAGTVAFASDASDISTSSGCGNFTAIFINNSTVAITVAYTYCSPGFDFCVPGQQGVLPCPCENPQQRDGATKGCNNSAATGGAVLHSGGAASLSADSVQFTSSGETPTATTIFLQGTAFNAGGVVFGQGVRCTDGALLRLYVTTAANGTASAPTGSDARVSARSAALGDSIVAGTPRFYSAYYRDNTVLGGCPSTSTFNTTQGQSLTWVP